MLLDLKQNLSSLQHHYSNCQLDGHIFNSEMISVRLYMNTDHSVVLKTSFDRLCVCTILPLLKLVSSLPSSHSTIDSLERSGGTASSCISCRCYHGKFLLPAATTTTTTKMPVYIFRLAPFLSLSNRREVSKKTGE